MRAPGYCVQIHDAQIVGFLGNPLRYGAVPTGSRALGLSSTSSDHDYVICRSDYSHALRVADRHYLQSYDEYEEAQGQFLLARFAYGEYEFDIIVVPNTAELNAWTYATTQTRKWMTEVSNGKELLTDKARRVEIFEAYKKEYRENASFMVSNGSYF